jgi:hypothetical protein
MSNRNSTHLMIIAAMAVLAGCSSAMSQEPNTAVVTQSGPDLASAFDAAPPEAAILDGAPSVIVPETYAAEARAPEPAPKPRPQPVYQRASLDCDIDVRRTANGIRITPVVHSDRKLNGEYTLVITKSGGGNSSDISQGGPFDVARGESVRLGSSEFSMERGAKFRATLKVRADGREVCRDVRS